MGIGIPIAKLIALVGADTSEFDEKMGGVDGKLKGFGKFAGEVGDVLGSFATIAGVATAIGYVGRELYEIGEEASQLDRVEQAGKSLAGSMSLDMDTVVRSIRNTSHGAINDFDAMSISAKAMSYGIGNSVTDITSLMEFAASKGRVMGLSTTDAFAQVVDGIGKMSSANLTNMGIMVDTSEAYADYAESLGKLPKNLTDMEKRQALLNDVLAQSREEMAAMTGLVNDSASEFEIFGNRIASISTNIKKDLLPAITSAVGGFNKLLAGNEANLDDLLGSEAILRASTSYKEYKEAITDAAVSQGLLIKSNGDLVKVTKSLTGTKEIMIQQNYVVTAQQWDQVHATDALVGSHTALGPAIKATTTDISALTAQGIAWNAQLNEQMVIQGNLKLSMDNFLQTTGNQMYDLLSNRLSVGTDKWRLAVEATDAISGTFNLTAFDTKMKLDDLAKAYANNTIGIDEYREGYQAIVDEGLSPFQDALEESISKAQDLYGKLMSIPTDIRVKIDVQVTGDDIPSWLLGDKDLTVDATGHTWGTATGGAVFGTRAVLVGERRPEMFRPFSAGWIDSDPQKNSGQPMTVVFNMQNTTLDETSLRDAMRRVERMRARG